MLRLVRDETINVSEPIHDANQDSGPRKRRKATNAPTPLRLAISDQDATPANTPPSPEEAPETSSAPAVANDDAALSIDGPVLDGDSSDATDASADTDAAVDLSTLEALLFSTHHPLTTARLAELMELKSAAPLRRAIKALNASYEQSGRSFRVEQVAGGYQLLTLPEYGDYLKRLHQKEIDAKLTKAALETLAIIAYKQPILRADVEAIRGVACGETIRSLMEKHLVRIAGRAEEPGRPILYGTTKRFLELFGLNSLKDLPQSDELRPPAPPKNEAGV